MKDISIEQFSANLTDVLSSVLTAGDICRISTDKGKVILMKEAEYNIMREALAFAVHARQAKQ